MPVSTSSLPILNFPIDCLMATSESETTLISRIAAPDRRAAIALLEKRSSYRSHLRWPCQQTVARVARVSFARECQGCGKLDCKQVTTAYKLTEALGRNGLEPEGGGFPGLPHALQFIARCLFCCAYDRYGHLMRRRVGQQKASG